MSTHASCTRARWISIPRAAIAALVFAALPLWAGLVGPHRAAPTDGDGMVGIFAPRAQLHGYSLQEMAKVTAAFNVTDHSGPPPAAVDGTRIQMLYTTANNAPFYVKKGTALYVPVFLSDDSPPVIGEYPANVNDREAILNYVYSQAQMGLVSSIIKIDGQSFPLDENYIAAVRVRPLPDGGGTRYLVSAAYVKPLKKGQHTVEISVYLTGAALGPWCEAVGFTCPDGLSWMVQYTVHVH